MAGKAHYEASLYERQIAVSLLAHAARRDNVAMAASLDAIADPSEDLRPASVIAVLLTEFQKGMDDVSADDLANWFAGEAQAIAARQSGADLV